MATADFEEVEADGRVLRISHPHKLFFRESGKTKLDLVRYYLQVGEAALGGVRERPVVLKRFPDGGEGPYFFQKRVPAGRPEWLQTVTVSFPSGRTAEELCPTDLAHIVWAVNLGCLELNPWPVRRQDLDHPDELRVDLDPQPGVSFATVKEVAAGAGALLREHGLNGFPKTSGSRGIHLNVPIEARWGFQEVRRAALALARELERRLPGQATSAWWKEERGDRVLVDYNQNARDRTVASAYSVRPGPVGLVSCPLRWDELEAARPEDFTMGSVPERLRRFGDPAEQVAIRPGSLSSLLDLADEDERRGLGDAPWPPHFAKQTGEPARVAPSRRRKSPSADR